MAMVWAESMWDIINIIWPACNDHLEERVEERVILDDGLGLRFLVQSDVHMVDGDVSCSISGVLRGA